MLVSKCRISFSTSYCLDRFDYRILISLDKKLIASHKFVIIMYIVFSNFAKSSWDFPFFFELNNFLHNNFTLEKFRTDVSSQKSLLFQWHSTNVEKQLIFNHFKFCIIHKGYSNFVCTTQIIHEQYIYWVWSIILSNKKINSEINCHKTEKIILNWNEFQGHIC